jgi:predicted ribosomally synthesized peptide with SipW-like signal peptide
MGLGHLGPLKGDIKVKKKTLLIIIVVIAIAAISAAGAYAWWTSTDTTVSGNQITTGQMGLTAGGDVPLSAAKLVPQARPPAGPDGDSTGFKTSYFYVTNTGDTPLMFYGYIPASWYDEGIGNVVWAKITIAPTDSPWGAPTGTLSALGGPYIVYEGPINALVGEAAGKAELSSRYYANSAWHHTPLAKGQQAWYKVVLWLDGATCDNGSQGKTLQCDLTFKGMQEENWVD